jgi:kumamolisin
MFNSHGSITESPTGLIAGNVSEELEHKLLEMGTPMSSKLCFPRVRCWIVAMLLAGSLVGVPVAAPGQVVLTDSVKGGGRGGAGPVDPHKAVITRTLLQDGESAAAVRFEVALKMRNFEELKGRIAGGGRVSRQEMAARYEPLAADYEAVAAWLTSQGLTITRRDSHHMAIFAQGKVSQVQQALHVSFARVALEGQEYTSAVTAPSVPGAFGPLLVGINGLQPHIRAHKHIIKRQDMPNALGGGASYFPKQIERAYDATSLYGSNLTGSGEAIAIVIDTFPAASDLEAFWKDAGVSQSISNIQFIQVVAG